MLGARVEKSGTENGAVPDAKESGTCSSADTGASVALLPHPMPGWPHLTPAETRAVGLGMVVLIHARWLAIPALARHARSCSRFHVVVLESVSFLFDVERIREFHVESPAIETSTAASTNANGLATMVLAMTVNKSLNRNVGAVTMRARYCVV